MNKEIIKLPEFVNMPILNKISNFKKIKIIILDRDGVINFDSPDFIKSPDEWHAIPGSLAAIAKLNNAGFKVVIASNQSGIARGYFAFETLDKIHQKMQNELAKVSGHLDGIFICPHGPNDNCSCRKPKPGLLEQIQKFFNCSKEEMLFIGDSPRDLEAAKAFGCDAILVKTGSGKNVDNAFDVPVFEDLAIAVTKILN